MELLDEILGLQAEQLTAYQMAVRAVMIFFISLLLIRVSGIRTLGKQSAFDTLTSVMLGAIMGRAIVTNQPFFASLLAALVLMLLHRLTAWVTFKSKYIGGFVKGRSILLFENGKQNLKNQEKTLITDEDILEALRQNANSGSLKDIKEIHLERSGEISIVKE